MYKCKYLLHFNLLHYYLSLYRTNPCTMYYFFCFTILLTLCILCCHFFRFFWITSQLYYRSTKNVGQSMSFRKDCRNPKRNKCAFLILWRMFFSIQYILMMTIAHWCPWENGYCKCAKWCSSGEPCKLETPPFSSESHKS